MFPQRSPTVPSPYIITLALGGWREHSIFLYGNCCRNRSTESLPELPIPKLTDIVDLFVSRIGGVATCVIM